MAWREVVSLVDHQLQEFLTSVTLPTTSSPDQRAATAARIPGHAIARECRTKAR
jgi:hypothetical protein